MIYSKPLCWRNFWWITLSKLWNNKVLFAYFFLSEMVYDRLVFRDYNSYWILMSFSLQVFCLTHRIWKHMINPLWKEIQRQFSCYWLAQPPVTDILFMINVFFYGFPELLLRKVLSQLFYHNLKHLILYTLPVKEEQRDKSFLESLQHNYGKPPNESKLPMFYSNGMIMLIMAIESPWSVLFLQLLGLRTLNFMGHMNFEWLKQVHYNCFTVWLWFILIGTKDIDGTKYQVWEVDEFFSQLRF